MQVLKPIYFEAGPNEAYDRLVKEERLNRLEFYAKQDIVHLCQLEPHQGKCAIVGAAPSVKKYIHDIDAIRRTPGLVMSINGAHSWLVNEGCPPTIHVLFEIDMGFEDATGGPPYKNTYYYICSHYDPKTYHRLDKFKRVLWHHYDKDEEYQGHINRLYPNEFMVSGGFVTFFRCVNIALILGFRDFEFFGCDCSFEGGSSHFENYPNVAAETEMTVAAGTKDDYRMFKTKPSLSFLAHEFMRFCEVNQAGLKIKVHGDGMLRHLHQKEFPEQYS